MRRTQRRNLFAIIAAAAFCIFILPDMVSFDVSAPDSSEAVHGSSTQHADSSKSKESSHHHRPPKQNHHTLPPLPPDDESSARRSPSILGDGFVALVHGGAVHNEDAVVGERGKNGANIEAADGECRHAITDGGHEMVDDRGVICPAFGMEGKSCCPATSESFQYDCSTCVLKGGGQDHHCCTTLGQCISCCLRDDFAPIRGNGTYYRRFLPLFRDAIRVMKRSVERRKQADGKGGFLQSLGLGRGTPDVTQQPQRRKRGGDSSDVAPNAVEDWDAGWDYCLARCRSSSRSTYHQNRYKSPLHHCFGQNSD